MLERIFSLAGMVVLPCWILIAVAPRWKWSQRLATFVAPLLIACVYGWLLLGHASPKGGGFSSLAQVAVLFSSPYALLAGWIHYLAFDLFTGAWEARDAARLCSIIFVGPMCCVCIHAEPLLVWEHAVRIQ